MISKDIKEGYYNKLKNKLFGLLCEYEKSGEWEAFLDSIIIEMMGLPDECKPINYITIMSRINTLKYLRYEYFRKTIFDCINLLSKED